MDAIEELPVDDPVENKELEAKFCHVRHMGCPSMLALCGSFKPYAHSPGQVVPYGTRLTGEHCHKCGKELCPLCILADTHPCPQCGGNSRSV